MKLEYPAALRKPRTQLKHTRLITGGRRFHRVLQVRKCLHFPNKLPQPYQSNRSNIGCELNKFSWLETLSNLLDPAFFPYLMSLSYKGMILSLTVTY